MWPKKISIPGAKNKLNIGHNNLDGDRVLGITVFPRYERKTYATDKDLLQLSYLDHSLFTFIRFYIIAFGL